MAPDDDKFRELVLFLCSRSEVDPRFGATKLNKLLFYCDFLAYVQLGKAITGHLYQRLPHGPAPQKMVPIMKRMITTRQLAIQARDHFGRTQKTPIALRKANLDQFSSAEIALVTEVLDSLRSKNARGISSLSHQFAGWKLAKDREVIRYEVALVHIAKPRKRDIKKATLISAQLTALKQEVEQSDERN
jgi:Protein of unknown function (DUF4065)